MSVRPNFFVGIRLPCPSFANAVVHIQDHVVERVPQLLKCRMDVRKLHLTCFVMPLSGAEQINKAVECLTQYQHDVDELTLTLKRKAVTFDSVGNFTTKVLFACPTQDETMQILSLITQQLEKRFRKAGIIADLSHDSRVWQPHATILKTSYDRKNGKKLKIKPEDYAGTEVHLRSPTSPSANDFLCDQTSEGG